MLPTSSFAAQKFADGQDRPRNPPGKAGKGGSWATRNGEDHLTGELLPAWASAGRMSATVSMAAAPKPSRLGREPRFPPCLLDRCDMSRPSQHCGRPGVAHAAEHLRSAA